MQTLRALLVRQENHEITQRKRKKSNQIKMEKRTYNQHTVLMEKHMKRYIRIFTHADMIT